MSATTDFIALLPSERLIAECRNGVEPESLAAAASLRLAAAEIVREGYLLHYGEPRWYVIKDADLALLAGDRMYASGLAVLAEDGDTEAVEALAKLIAGCAEAHAVDDSARADSLWQSTLAMLARGSD